MKAALKNLAHRLDLRLARSHLGAERRKDYLVILFFHSLLQDEGA